MGTYQGTVAFGNAAPLPASCTKDVFSAHFTTAFPDPTVNAVQAVQGSIIT
jgi:hypothetical protein